MATSSTVNTTLSITKSKESQDRFRKSDNRNKIMPLMAQSVKYNPRPGKSRKNVKSTTQSGGRGGRSNARKSKGFGMADSISRARRFRRGRLQNRTSLRSRKTKVGSSRLHGSRSSRRSRSHDQLSHKSGVEESMVQKSPSPSRCSEMLSDIRNLAAELGLKGQNQDFSSVLAKQSADANPFLAGVLKEVQKMFNSGTEIQQLGAETLSKFGLSTYDVLESLLLQQGNQNSLGSVTNMNLVADTPRTSENQKMRERRKEGHTRQRSIERHLLRQVDKECEKKARQFGLECKLASEKNKGSHSRSSATLSSSSKRTSDRKVGQPSNSNRPTDSGRSSHSNRPADSSQSSHSDRPTASGRSSRSDRPSDRNRSSNYNRGSTSRRHRSSNQHSRSNQRPSSIRHSISSNLSSRRSNADLPPNSRRPLEQTRDADQTSISMNSPQTDEMISLNTLKTISSLMQKNLSALNPNSQQGLLEKFKLNKESLGYGLEITDQVRHAASNEVYDTRSICQLCDAVGHNAKHCPTIVAGGARTTDSSASLPLNSVLLQNLGKNIISNLSADPQGLMSSVIGNFMSQADTGNKHSSQGSADIPGFKEMGDGRSLQRTSHDAQKRKLPSHPRNEGNKKEKIGVKKNTCQICDEKGHWSKDCPRSVASAFPNVHPSSSGVTLSCILCNSVGDHATRNCPNKISYPPMKAGLFEAPLQKSIFTPNDNPRYNDHLQNLRSPRATTYGVKPADMTPWGVNNQLSRAPYPARPSATSGFGQYARNIIESEQIPRLIRRNVQNVAGDETFCLRCGVYGHHSRYCSA